MTGREKLKEVAQGFLETATAILVTGDDVLPVVAVMKDGKIPLVLGMAWETSEQKVTMFRMLEQELRDTRADGCVFVTDSWMAEAGKAGTPEQTRAVMDSPNFVPPSERVDRKEALSVTVVDAKGCEGLLLPYTRGEPMEIGEVSDWCETESNLIGPAAFQQ